MTASKETSSPVAAEPSNTRKPSAAGKKAIIEAIRKTRAEVPPTVL
jgi:hypothetical protein